MRKAKASLLVVAATAVTVATLFMQPFTPKIAVRTAVIAKGDLIRSVLVEGMVSYDDQQPCVAVSAGRIAKVHVREGQAVQAGELLISMDTSMEEAALASLSQMLYEQESALENAGALSAVLAQSLLDARKQQEQLKAAITAGQLRAQKDGVVGSLYANEGEYVASLSVLAIIHGQDMAVTAMGRAAELAHVRTGAPALVATPEGQGVAAAVLTQIGAPDTDEAAAQVMQSLTLRPVEQSALAQHKPGDRVVVELVCESIDDMALVPLSAVDEEGRIWLVSDGAATPVKADLSKCNDAYVALDAKWAGKRVILLPDTYHLYPGCAVKEAAKR